MTATSIASLPSMASFETKKICAECAGSKEKLLLCGQCKQIHYCSAECQKIAWKMHKLVCGKPEGTADTSGLTLAKWSEFCGLSERPQPVLPGLDDRVCLWDDGQGQVEWMTQQIFHERTGKWYSPTPLFTQPAWLKMHVFAESPSEKVLAFPPDEAPQVAIFDQGELGLGLKARGDIQEGELICRYGGIGVVRNPNQPVSYEYLLNNFNLTSELSFDGSKICAPGAFINEGPPNCEMVQVKGKEGSPAQFVVKALRTIKKGEILYLHYGSDHPIKHGKYLLGTEEYKLVKSQIRKVTDLFPKVSDSRYKQVMAQWVLSTPYVLIKLLLEDHLDIGELLSLVNFNMDYLQNWFGEDAEIMVRALLNGYSNCQKRISKAHEAVSQFALINICCFMQAMKKGQINTQKLLNLGKFLDDYRFSYHGTLLSSYRGTTREKEIPEVPFPFEERLKGVSKEFHSLLGQLDEETRATEGFIKF